MKSRQIFNKNLSVLSMYNTFDFASFNSFYIDTNLSQIGKKFSLGTILSELAFID
jgi:hypothetical protein